MRINRIDEIASRRLARTAQVAALPPQPERLDQNLWHLNRVPWVHERRPGLLSRTVGAVTPIKHALADPRVQAALTTRFGEIDFPALMVSPELPSEIYDAITLSVATYNPNTPSDALLQLYKPAGYHERASIITNTAPFIQSDAEIFRYVGNPVLAPCILREIAWSSGSMNVGFNTVTLYVEGYGVLYTTESASPVISQSIGGSARGLDQWVLSGALVPIVELRALVAGTNNWNQAASINVIVEPLIRV